MTGQFRDALRKLKPERKTGQFIVRSSGNFAAAATLATGRFPFVPDTSVYVGNAAAILPAAVTDILDRGGLQFHCIVCLGEIIAGVSAFHPDAAGYDRVRAHYQRLLHTIPDNRVLTPDEDIWLEAGIVSGTLARTQGLQRHQRKEFLNDALIYLTAAKYGLPVLTANRDDFDLIQQVTGRGQFIHY